MSTNIVQDIWTLSTNVADSHNLRWNSCIPRYIFIRNMCTHAPRRHAENIFKAVSSVIFPKADQMAKMWRLACLRACVLSHVQLFCDPTDNSLPGSPIHGFYQARILEQFAISCCCCCCYVASVMSNSVRPHRRQPTRLPRPWDSPGKNTGVGRHFLLQCLNVKSESEVAQSCPTLSDPMDCRLPGSSIHGIVQARVLESLLGFCYSAGKKERVN